MLHRPSNRAASCNSAHRGSHRQSTKACRRLGNGWTLDANIESCLLEFRHGGSAMSLRDHSSEEWVGRVKGMKSKPHLLGASGAKDPSKSSRRSSGCPRTLPHHSQGHQAARGELHRKVEGGEGLSCTSHESQHISA
eukprot:CAMPEP_0206533738 /NCGR_PEP_ID=MMETSP0325_2-20121206/5135_1 /ASSEMBLY_ACC=CAM_ASM_000347 /TAXON_ID=2866 /ORGANISM="Crypthecodinium cohnii, Strain Seligo" /LENGTH=136 /DNA_ID=CAMNT_0054030421 /DNA_START=209 /DNA_END=619 /DNA_ORIENTATION=-